MLDRQVQVRALQGRGGLRCAGRQQDGGGEGSAQKMGDGGHGGAQSKSGTGRRVCAGRPGEDLHQKPKADFSRLKTLVLSRVPLNGLAPAPVASSLTSPPPCVSDDRRTPVSWR